MKSVTVWESSDGRRFDEPEACVRNDALLVAIADAMRPLGKQRDIKSNEYVQHTREACLQAKRGLVALARERFGKSHEVFNAEPDKIHPLSIAGRILCDSDSPIYSGWNRLMRINWDNFREYEQPYFAKNPHEATVEMS